MQFALEQLSKDNNLWRNEIYTDVKIFLICDQSDFCYYQLKGDRYVEKKVTNSLFYLY